MLNNYLNRDILYWWILKLRVLVRKVILAARQWVWVSHSAGDKIYFYFQTVFYNKMRLFLFLHVSFRIKRVSAKPRSIITVAHRVIRLLQNRFPLLQESRCAAGQVTASQLYDNIIYVVRLTRLTARDIILNFTKFYKT